MVSLNQTLANPELMATGKDTSKPLKFNDSPLSEVNTSRSDENSMKL